jgi:prepilin-type N-terminal cleavage/methylation domain-containing protein
MTGRERKAGFTLVEMLVVIGIIVVLVAILFPVFATARQKATQTKCIAKMQNLLTALKDYRRDYRRYPPRPSYEYVAAKSMYMYVGGFSALFPDYIDSWEELRCPSDRSVDRKEDEARQKRYCSYNGVVQDPGNDQWEFVNITYNFDGYDNDGWNDPTSPVPPAAVPAWLAAEDKGWKHYPRLSNRNALDYTIVTHCTNHRSFYNNEKDWKDTIIWLNADVDTITVAQWRAVGANGASLFKSQIR